MRLATFNLLHGMAVTSREVAPDAPDAGGTRDARDDSGIPGPLAAALGALRADVLGLQEVDVHQSRSGGVHQVALAAAVMDTPHWRFVPSVLGTPGMPGWQPATGAPDPLSDHTDTEEDIGPRYGVGLVSRLPVLHWRARVLGASWMRLPLLIPGPRRPRVMLVADEPRVAIAAVVQGPQGPLSVVTAHLSFVPGVNIRQLRILRTWVADLPRPVVLMGDLNLPGPIPRRVTGWTSLAEIATYPSFGPRIQFDHLLAQGLPDATLAAARASAQRHSLPVSDHAALSVDLPG